VTTNKLLTGFSNNHNAKTKLGNWIFWSAIFVATLAAGTSANAAIQCDQTITANVVVLDNPTVFNRLGAQNPNWITYALERDVVNRSTQVPCSMAGANCTAGNVELRRDKRPRPLVIRSVAESCLTVNFTNLLSPVANPNNAQQDQLINNDQVAGRCAGFHATGTELVNGMEDDGSMVGANPGSNIGPTDAGQANCGVGLAAPGETRIYELYTPHEGAFIINSYGAVLGSESNSGNLGIGMFGALNVQPKHARLYRSQMTEEEMRLATTGYTALGQPIIDYEALYPPSEPWISEGKAGLPIVNMLTATGELVHSDINAIIAGPDADGTWNSLCPGAECPYPLESVGKKNPQLPQRLEAFREFTSQFHDEQTNSQVFPQWYNNPVMRHVTHGVKDQFMINYGSGGIGSEIISNRLHTGPMHDCTDCAYEEFFLASQTVGDPALLVNFPANTGIEQCDPAAIAGPTCWRDPVNLRNGPVATFDPVTGDLIALADNYALFQEDPSNVHHAYTGDFVKYRNTHAGAFEQHIFHFHNHQWLFNPNDDNANYLDAQEIMPGSGHTYEIVNGGAGNRNHTTGDAIFHCHFYPHFAQGMWYHQRNHDVFETGTVLEVSNANDPQKPALFDPLNPAANFHSNEFDLRSGKPAAGSRALPDGELPNGSPIPAVVPLPGKPMPHMPAHVEIRAVDRGSHSILGGRGGPDGLPDSAQAVVSRASVAGPDGTLHTGDDVSPGYPFWLAGNECGPTVDPATAPDLLVGDAAVTGCPQGIVGQRMPTPPLDMLTEAGAMANAGNPNPDLVDWSNLGGGWDGGLPRHALLGYVSGGLSADTNSRLDFRKIVEMAKPVYFPEIGTDLEQVSMAYQAVRRRDSYANNFTTVEFPTPADANTFVAGGWVLNGAPPVPGGPYNDPCVDDQGDPLRAGTPGDWYDGNLTDAPDRGRWTSLTTQGVSPFDGENPRTYKLANLQIDAVFNKVGYHYSQERIIILWEDVAPTILKDRPPEPLVMRFNTFDCGKILHANLVPHEFELDDFQVRTPTDIIGQHIHLPKWDLTTGDGAANGWNYEDGALSPGIVEERILAIKHYNDAAGTILPAGSLLGQLAPIDLTDQPQVAAIDTGDPGSTTVAGQIDLVAQPHYFFGDGFQGQHYTGARTVIQRILVDPVVNVAGVDRGLGLTFSHDHYGPSTFQQIGLYSTILAEPAGSTWVHNETGAVLNTRDDGGPTTWQAAILTPNTTPAGSTVQSEKIPDHREFYFEMSDFQHAYEKDVFVGADANGVPLPTAIIQPDPFNALVATAPALEKTWLQAVNPTLKLTANGGVNPGAFPDTVNAHPGCPGPLGQNDPNIPRPCAEAINIGHSSMWVVNYRNEPIGLRVFDPSATGPDGLSGTQALGQAGDLALAFQSRRDRAISQLNTSFGDMPYPEATYCDRNNPGDEINCDRRPGDPITPIMRAYEADHVKVKIQVGATEEQHQTTVHGVKWLSNGSGFGRSPNSGWRNFQSHGISEQFSLQIPILPDRNQTGNNADYLYATDATRDGIWSGTWGILRSYGNRQNDLFELPDNPQQGSINFANDNEFNGVCPRFVLDENGDRVDPPGRDKNIPVPVREFTVYAVRANDVLPNDLGVIITPNIGGDSDGDGLGDNVGGPLNTAGGTLVYNRRGTAIPDVLVGEGAEQVLVQGGAGPLNDPTALMYVLEEDLVPGFIPGVSPDSNGDDKDDRCQDFKGGGVWNPRLQNAGCPVKLRPGAPVEPLILRAEAGECIEVTLHNKLMNQATTEDGSLVYVGSPDGTPVFDEVLAAKGNLVDASGAPVAAADLVYDTMPDLAGWQDTFWVVNRDLFKPVNQRNQIQMSFFGNNLIRPSERAGLHAQLVEYDVSRHDGVVVGQNNQNLGVANPGGQTFYRWYAGHIDTRFVGMGGNRNNPSRDFARVAFPVEFGASNLLSSDRVKQPQKGMFGALVIEPAGATVVADTQVPDGQGTGSATRETRAQVDVTAPDGTAGSGGTYRETIAIAHKIGNLRWADGSAIKNVNQAEFGVEGAEDSGHAGFNYGTEPGWFRFKLPPDVPFGNAGTPNSYGSIPNPQAMYANALVAGEPNAIPDIAGVATAGDPQTPVFRASANAVTGAAYNTRMHVLNGASADRDSTYILHGHVWPRDPYVCTGVAGSEQDASLTTDGSIALAGRCDPWVIAPSNALGLNQQAKYMGGEEGMGHVFGHWPILFDAGGTGAVPGDYLYRDYAPNGNRNGMFGILRVE
jgi:hypothetical protein